MPPPPGIPERPPVLKATGMWLPRPDWPRLAVVTGAAAALGGVVVAASDLTPMWQLVLLAAVATGAVMFWCRDLKTFFLCGMVFTTHGVWMCRYQGRVTAAAQTR